MSNISKGEERDMSNGGSDPLAYYASIKCRWDQTLFKKEVDKV